MPFQTGEKGSKLVLPVANCQPLLVSVNLNFNCGPAVAAQLYAINYYDLIASRFPDSVIDEYLATPRENDTRIEAFIIFRDLVLSAVSPDKSDARKGANTELLIVFQSKLDRLKDSCGIIVEHDDLNKLLGFLAYLFCYSHSILVTKKEPKEATECVSYGHCRVCKELLTPLAIVCPHTTYTGRALPVVPTLISLPASHGASLGCGASPQQFVMIERPQRVRILLYNYDNRLIRAPCRS